MMENETLYSEISFKKTKPKFILIKNLPLSVTTRDLYTLLEAFSIDVYLR